jgi:hypothetical protein
VVGKMEFRPTEPKAKLSWTIGLLSLKWDQAEGTLRVMLFMVIERFKHGDAKPIGERFKRSGRMLPEGVTYQASWVDSKGTRCFQLMEAPHPELLSAWVSRWDDLIDFEIVPVLTSNDFWAQAQLE